MKRITYLCLFVAALGLLPIFLEARGSHVNRGNGRYQRVPHHRQENSRYYYHNGRYFSRYDGYGGYRSGFYIEIVPGLKISIPVKGEGKRHYRWDKDGRDYRMPYNPRYRDRRRD